LAQAYSINPLANKTLKRQLEDEDCEDGTELVCSEG